MDRKYQFTSDTFAQCRQTWPNIFDLIKWDPHRKCRVVEIGSYEGQATVWILDNLIQHPDSKVWCIDPFKVTGRKEQELNPSTVEDWNLILQRFKSNIALIGKANQVELLQKPSSVALSSLLATEAGQVDFIYVDGSHRRPMSYQT